jgi:hypothetical protein
MKKFLILIALTLTCAALAQTAISPGRATQRLSKPAPGVPPPPPKPATSQTTQTRPLAKPPEIVAVIDQRLGVSKVNLLGLVEGLKGTFYVTNLSQQTLTPTIQLAILDHNNRPIGSTNRIGGELPPKGIGKIEVKTSNPNAGDFKLLKISGNPAGH